MSSTASSRTSSSRSLALLASWALASCAAAPEPRLLLSDDFANLDQWVIEAECPDARVSVRDGVLDIDTPRGITLWFRHELTGPVEIEFVATAVSEGGANDQVSDLNVFWMASNRDGSSPISANRSGRFAEYNDLRTYYVGLGGNRNTTSRFRRYIGDADVRPLLPEHDLSTPDVMLVPNREQKITLVADRSTIEYKRDGGTLFHLEDPAPYTRGWFALRTTQSHLRIERLRVRALRPEHPSDR
jgi:hypothetical protein